MKNEIIPLVLEENENHKITYYDVGSVETFIVFHGINGGINSKPFGFDYLINSNYNLISCNSKHGLRYQSLSFNKFKNIVSPYLVNKNPYLYGSSLGGYCALYYAGAVNGIVFAAAPRNSFHPMFYNKYNQKINKDNFNHSYFFHENELTDKPVFILYDSKNNQDNKMINKLIIKSYPDAFIHKYDYIGHPNLLRNLLKANKLKKLLIYL